MWRGWSFTNSFYHLFERIPHNLQSFPLHAISLFMALILISRVESLSVCLGLTKVLEVAPCHVSCTADAVLGQADL